MNDEIILEGENYVGACILINGSESRGHAAVGRKENGPYTKGVADLLFLELAIRFLYHYKEVLNTIEEPGLLIAFQGVLQRLWGEIRKDPCGDGNSLAKGFSYGTAK
jgi:hypothetical protein